MIMEQNDAVCAATLSLLEEKGITLQEGQEVKPLLSKEDISHIVDVVTQGMLDGVVKLSERARENYQTEAAVRKYVVGMVDNTFRKDKRMNGGVKYVPKNPGSRAGLGDPALKACRDLLSITEDPAAREAIQASIDARLAELQKEKAAKAVTINPDDLPEELRKFLK